MVSCRSCGRIITSGIIRCTKCSSPFHLSCSHRYKISPYGVFNVCCGPKESIFPGNAATLHMRVRNKRRTNLRQRNLIRKINFEKGIGNKVATSIANVNQEDEHYGKVQKISDDMGTNEEPINDDSPEIIIEEDYTVNEIDNFDDNESVAESEQPVNNEEDNEVHNEAITKSIIAANSINNKITLETVWQGISALQSSISNISNSLDTVSNQLNTFDPRIIELESTLNNIKTKTAIFENLHNDVSGFRADLERLSSELESLKSTQPQKSMDVSQIFIEIKEREIKSRNIIIYNVQEDNLRISQDYSTVDDINKFNNLVVARDNSRAREILDNIPNIDLDDLQTRRLGRINQSNCRPLRVTLQSRADVINVMKNRGLVDKTYTVKSDLTKFQQNKIKELKEQLDKQNVNKNNPVMTIKFVSGEPQIIQIRRNFLKPE